MVWGSGAREARVCAGSGRDPKGALRPGRPGARTPGIARTPRHERPHPPRRAPGEQGARQTQARRAQTRAHRCGAAPTRRDAAARRHASPKGTRTRAASAPVTFMSLTMAWKSPPRAPHSFSAVSMLGPGGGGAGRALGPAPRRLSLRGRAEPGASGPRSAAGRAALGGRGPPRGGAGHVAAGLAGGAGGAARAAGSAAAARGLARRP